MLYVKIYSHCNKYLMRNAVFSYTIFLLILAMPLFTACSGTSEDTPVKEIVVMLDAENQLYVDGEKIHLTRLQNLVETQTRHEQASYILQIDDKACIHRVNDITRTLHPAPLQFASAQ